MSAAYGEAPGWTPERPRFRAGQLVLAWLLGAVSLLIATRLVPGASDSTTTEVALPPECLMAVMRVSITTFDPWASTFSVQTSHIIPGPYFGYWNSSMREVMSFWLRFGRTAFMTALNSDRFLIRCAAQSAWISVAGTPHTFSV